MRVAIIGCGLIGKKRALSLGLEDELVACCDTNLEGARKFSEEFKCKYYTDYRILLNEAICDSVIVAVINIYAKDIVIAALNSGKHVLAEKPLGRNAKESSEILEYLSISQSPILSVSQSPVLSVSQSLILKTGFNHRFHPAIWKAKEISDEGKIGKLFNIRARYGHGGRPGMEKEWRASKGLCGGGELLDQGVHIIDLIRWFGGGIIEVFGKVETKFWDIKVEDNALAILKTENNVTASFHVSWTNWKNIFSFEVFGTDGYLRIEGLGGSYGPETLEFGRRKKEGGCPYINVFEFSPEDISWKEEWKEFKKAIFEKREPIGSGSDGLKANQVINAIYRSNLEGTIIKIL